MSERLLAGGQRLLPRRAHSIAGRWLDRLTDLWEGIDPNAGVPLPPRRLRLRAGRFLRPEEYLRSGREAVRLLGAWLPDSGAGDLLEIGCGPGRIAAALPGAPWRWRTYEGFDIAAEPIEWAEAHLARRNPALHFSAVDVRNGHYERSGRVPADRFTFPYDDGQFDTVIAISVFTHLLPAAVERYLVESRRVLRPGGRLIASCFVVPRAAAGEAARSDPPLRPERQGRFLIERVDDPEAFVGLWADALEEMLERTGWSASARLRRGTWLFPERADATLRSAGFRQDLLVAERPDLPG